ncbi:hypothetical protein ES705_23472 [subsurface metagenome]
MDFFNSLIFLLILLMILVSIKADFFFIIFGLVILFYVIIKLFLMDPYEILSSVVSFIFLNPIGFTIIFIPLIINYIHKFLSKYFKSRRDLERN